MLRPQCSSISVPLYLISNRPPAFLRTSIAEHNAAINLILGQQGLIPHGPGLGQDCVLDFRSRPFGYDRIAPFVPIPDLPKDTNHDTIRT